jgi:hypothetical protein
MENDVIELPEPRFTRIIDGVRCLTVTEHEAQLKAYGEACRKEALEEAAKVCFEAEEPDDEYVSTRHTIAKAIKELLK